MRLAEIPDGLYAVMLDSWLLMENPQADDLIFCEQLSLTGGKFFLESVNEK